MIRFLPSPRRLLALAGAVAVGVAAAVAFASPASAHFTAVSGKFSCDTSTGEWVVSWTVTSHNTPAEATMFKLAGIVIGPAGSTITWATPPDQLQSINTPFTGTQRLPGSATSAKLAVRGSWNNGHVEDTFNTAVVTLTGTCAAPAPKPAATFAAACDRSVTVTLANSADATGPARFTVTGEHGFTASKTVDAGKQDTVLVPPADAKKVTVTEGAATTPLASNDFTQPATCGGLPVTGMKVGAAAAGALGVVGFGAGLFVAARRRRIRFTA